MNNNLKHKEFTAYIKRIHPYGYLRVDVWDNDFSQYPERWNTKFIGYSISEVKALIEAGLKGKYKPTAYTVSIEFDIIED